MPKTLMCDPRLLQKELSGETYIVTGANSGAVLRPLAGPLGTMSGFEGAQTTLHCLLDDEAPQHNGEYYSQNSVFYPDPKDRPGGWPMPSPNPHAHDAELAERLHQRSLELTGLA